MVVMNFLANYGRLWRVGIEHLRLVLWVRLSIGADGKTRHCDLYTSTKRQYGLSGAAAAVAIAIKIQSTSRGQIVAWT